MFAHLDRDEVGYVNREQVWFGCILRMDGGKRGKMSKRTAAATVIDFIPSTSNTDGVEESP